MEAASTRGRRRRHMPVALGNGKETSMAHYPKKRGPPDAIEIDLADDGEVDDMRSWCEHFARTPEQLQAAVGKMERFLLGVCIGTRLADDGVGRLPCRPVIHGHRLAAMPRTAATFSPSLHLMCTTERVSHAICFAIACRRHHASCHCRPGEGSANHRSRAPKARSGPKEAGCSGGKIEFDDDKGAAYPNGKFEVDHSTCQDGKKYDLTFDPNFKLLTKKLD